LKGIKKFAVQQGNSGGGDMTMGEEMKSAAAAERMSVIQPEDPMWPSPANVFVARDSKGLCVVDVGCGGEAAVNRLAAKMNQRGYPLTEIHTIILSHAHPDHAGGIARILKHVQPRIVIHADDAEAIKNPDLLQTSFDVSLYKTYYDTETDVLAMFSDSGCAMSAVPEEYPLHTVKEGDFLDVGEHSFQVLHTPGHAPGHICLYDQGRKLLLSFDLVGRVPAWYSPGTGGATGFLASLDKIGGLGIDRILPSHGGPIEDPGEAISRTRDRILRREEKILAELQKGACSFRELNALLFKDPAVQMMNGVRITESHLVKLEQEGRIRREGCKSFLIQ
jgi:glyoxylase-like metal-dependent hydrolase (beta-lactamase superfamily II)